MACIYANDESSLSVTLQGGWVLTECFAAGENEIDRHNYSAQPRSNCKSPWIIGICIFMMEVIHNLISALKMKYKMAYTLTRVCHQKKKKEKKYIWEGGGKNWVQWSVLQKCWLCVCLHQDHCVFASGESHITFFKGSNNKVFQLSYRRCPPIPPLYSFNFFPLPIYCKRSNSNEGIQS